MCTHFGVSCYAHVHWNHTLAHFQAGQTLRAYFKTSTIHPSVLQSEASPRLSATARCGNRWWRCDTFKCLCQQGGLQRPTVDNMSIYSHNIYHLDYWSSIECIIVLLRFTLLLPACFTVFSAIFVYHSIGLWNFHLDTKMYDRNQYLWQTRYC